MPRSRRRFIYQDDKRAPGQHSSQLTSCGVRVVPVDDRYGDDEQPHDGSGRARACAEEALIVANHNTTLLITDRIPPRLRGTGSEHSFGLIAELGKHSDLPGVYAG